MRFRFCVQRLRFWGVILSGLAFYIDDITLQTATLPCELATPGATVSDQGPGAATVHGQVTDGSGQGWPVYARIAIEGLCDAGLHQSDDR